MDSSKDWQLMYKQLAITIAHEFESTVNETGNKAYRAIRALMNINRAVDFHIMQESIRLLEEHKKKPQ